MKNIHVIGPLALALAACSGGEESAETTQEEDAEIAANLDAVLATEDDLSAAREALQATGLHTLFKAPGASYTMLAPTDSALAALGGDDAPPPPVIAALLREHILPGHLDSGAILDAIEANGGPVTMSTVGNGTVRFERDGDTLKVNHSEGAGEARMVAAAGAAENGVVLKLDQLLVAPPSPAS